MRFEVSWPIIGDPEPTAIWEQGRERLTEHLRRSGLKPIGPASFQRKLIAIVEVQEPTCAP